MNNELEKPEAAKKGRPRSFDRQLALERALTVFWQRGFEPTTVSELCKVMGINPPSLYAAFGNKAKLFLEAVNYYEDTYWGKAWTRLETDADLTRAIRDFFGCAVDILTSQEAPCGCIVVNGATNVSLESREVSDALRALRIEGKQCFKDRLMKGVEAGQLPLSAPVDALASTLNALLEGMSIEARDGGVREELERIATAATAFLPNVEQPM